MQRRLLQFALSALFVLYPVEEHSLAATYGEGLSLTEENESTFAIEATDATATVNGLELPKEVVDQMGVAQISERTESTTRIVEIVEVSAVSSEVAPWAVTA